MFGLFFAGLLGYGLFSRVLDARSVTPQMVLLGLGLAFGVVAGGTDAVTVDTELLHIAGEAALILCLFVDAARIDVGALRGTAGLPIRLLAIGLPLTILAGTIAAAALLPGITVLDAVLVAVLVAPTDAALGGLVVASPRVPLRIRQALNVESGLNDGLVTPIVLLLVAIGATEGDADATTGWIADAVSQIGLGSIAGIAVGVGGALLLRVALRRSWILPGADWVAAPALAFLAWFLADLLGGNAFVAAFVAGLASTATFGRVPDAFLEFGEVGGELLGLTVFFLFGVLVPVLGPYDLPVLLFAVLALTVVRMAPVALALARTGLAPSTVAFVGWFGPRGLASVVLAIVALGFGDSEPSLAPIVVSAVALTVVMSVFAHGITAGPGVDAYARTVLALPDDSSEHAEAVALRTRGRAVATGTRGRGSAEGGGSSRLG